MAARVIYMDGPTARGACHPTSPSSWPRVGLTVPSSAAPSQLVNGRPILLLTICARESIRRCTARGFLHKGTKYALVPMLDHHASPSLVGDLVTLVMDPTRSPVAVVRVRRWRPSQRRRIQHGRLSDSYFLQWAQVSGLPLPHPPTPSCRAPGACT